MTNREKLQSLSDRELAEKLIFSEVTEEVLYYTPDYNRFDVKESAIEHTLKWLKEGYDSEKYF